MPLTVGITQCLLLQRILSYVCSLTQVCSCFVTTPSFRCLKNAFPYSYDVIIMAHAGATLATRAVIPTRTNNNLEINRNAEIMV